MSSRRNVSTVAKSRGVSPTGGRRQLGNRQNGEMELRKLKGSGGSAQSAHAERLNLE